MKAYAQPPRDCNSPPCTHPITGKVNCNACPECCGQYNVPIEGWQAYSIIFICLLMFALYVKHLKNKKSWKMWKK